LKRSPISRLSRFAAIFDSSFFANKLEYSHAASCSLASLGLRSRAQASHRGVLVTGHDTPEPVLLSVWRQSGDQTLELSASDSSERLKV
jgi:hypothetical protein